MGPVGMEEHAVLGVGSLPADLPRGARSCPCWLYTAAQLGNSRRTDHQFFHHRYVQFSAPPFVIPVSCSPSTASFLVAYLEEQLR
jgi:hypothetical protein